MALICSPGLLKPKNLSSILCQLFEGMLNSLLLVMNLITKRHLRRYSWACWKKKTCLHFHLIWEREKPLDGIKVNQYKLLSAQTNWSWRELRVGTKRKCYFNFPESSEGFWTSGVWRVDCSWCRTSTPTRFSLFHAQLDNYNLLLSNIEWHYVSKLGDWLTIYFSNNYFQTTLTLEGCSMFTAKVRHCLGQANSQYRSKAVNKKSCSLLSYLDH